MHVKARWGKYDTKIDLLSFTIITLTRDLKSIDKTIGKNNLDSLSGKCSYF